MICEICGHTGFHFQPVVWDSLAEAWELSAEQRHQIDRQQGQCCEECGANLRSIALAGALRRAFAWREWLRDVPLELSPMRVLEINEAGHLSPHLERIHGHRLECFPDIDMQRLPHDAGSFDLVVHSDTLEHVEDPLRALRECRRVLAPGAPCCFTVPLVVGRMSRSRRGLPPSYHDGAQDGPGDQLVQTEFGADVWSYVLEAGFDRVELFSIGHPCATAITAWSAARAKAEPDLHE